MLDSINKLELKFNLSYILSKLILNPNPEAFKILKFLSWKKDLSKLQILSLPPNNL